MEATKVDPRGLPQFLQRNARVMRKAFRDDDEHVRNCPIPAQPVCPRTAAEAIKGTGKTCAHGTPGYRYLPSVKKLFYIPVEGTFFYRVGAVPEAKKDHMALTLRMKKLFDSWIGKWSSKNVTKLDAEKTVKWFMGEVEGLRPNKTTVKRIEVLTLPPYVPYNTYKCEFLSLSETVCS